jgi:hypothetical protein
MKKFIIQLLIYLIPITLLSYGADKFLSNNLKKSNNFADGEFSTWNDIYEGKINSDIVIYGSSNAWVQIDPGLIHDSLDATAYNLGINGHNFRLQYFRHSLLLKYNRKPKLIILSLNIFSFEKENDLYNPDQFLPYMLNNKEMENTIIGFNGYKSFDFKIPLIRYYGKKEAIIHTFYLLIKPSKNVVKRIKGYQARDMQWNDDLLKAEIKLGSYEVKLDSSLIPLFEIFCNECKQTNIETILVYPPEYIEGQLFIKNRDKIMSIFYNLSKKHDIPFYDFSGDSISFQKKYFYNSGHLNKVGAELFTDKLIHVLKKSSLQSIHNLTFHSN